MNPRRPRAARYQPRQPTHHTSKDEEHQPDIPAKGSHLSFVRLEEVDHAVAPYGHARDEDQPRQP